MKILLAQIQAIGMLARDWHYNAKGQSFYAEHLLADKVGEDLPTDELTETYYLGEKESVPPTQAEIAREAISIVEAHAAEDFPVRVKAVLKLAAAHAEELARAGRCSIGTKSLLDAVSQKCYVGVGLIERTLTK